MGRQTKKLRILMMAWVIAMLAAGLFIQPAWADPAIPTNFQLESAQVFRHLVEDDDFLVVFHYNIHYDTGQPSTPASKLFTFRLLDTNGIDYLAAVEPYICYNSGYDQGCAAFYFSAEEALELELEWEASYIVRISGSPEYFSSPPVTNRTLAISDYCQGETKEENQTALGDYVLDVAKDLQVNWTTELVSSGAYGTVFTSTGELYFRGTIPGLQVMAPQIFATQVTTPEYEETEWTEAQGKAYESRFEDTWLGKSLESFGDMLHVKWNVITGISLLVVLTALAVWCQRKYATVKPVMICGALFMLGGTALGWVAPAIMAIVTILFALFLGYVWIFRHG